MENNLKSTTPQFIKTLDYNDDHVRNSMENNHRPPTYNQQIYKSPHQKDYQSKYPASYNNIHQQRKQPGIRMSPPKNHRSPNVRFYDKFSINQDINRINNYTSPPRNNPYTSLPYTLHSPSYQGNWNQQPVNSYGSSHNVKSVIQLQKLVSQLKISLQQSLSSQSSVQQQLHKQKTRSFELSQMKRKLEQQLSKMQFELQRISNTDYLAQRQIYVKYDAQVMENQRLNNQVNELIEEVKRTKKQCRQFMTQANKTKQQCNLLRNDNLQLIDKMEGLMKQVSMIKQQLNISAMRERQLMDENRSIKFNHNYQSQNYGHQNHHQDGSQLVNYQNSNRNNNHMLPTHLNSLTTIRTHQQSSNHLSEINNSPNRFNPEHYNNHPHQTAQHIKHQQSPQTTKPNSSQYYKNTHNFNSPYQQNMGFEVQSSKMIQDYNRLLIQNQSMKKLYKQFYQQSSQKSNRNHQISSPPNSFNRSISEHSEQFESTDRKFYNQNQSPRLQTFQKNELLQQIYSLRQEVIDELIRSYFNQATKQAQLNKQNVLVLFIKMLTRNLLTIQKMVVNYLQARDLLKKELNVKRLTQGQEGQPHTQTQIQVEGMWQKIKLKLKSQIKLHKKENYPQSQTITLNINAYFLALFRLLTLIKRHENIDIENQSQSLSKLKHSALKYVHKIYEESCLLKQSINQVTNDKNQISNNANINKNQKYSLKR